MLEISHVLQCNRVDRDGICSGQLSGLTHDLDAYFLTLVFSYLRKVNMRIGGN